MTTSTRELFPGDLQCRRQRTPWVWKTPYLDASTARYSSTTTIVHYFRVWESQLFFVCLVLRGPVIDS